MKIQVQSLSKRGQCMYYSKKSHYLANEVGLTKYMMLCIIPLLALRAILSASVTEILIGLDSAFCSQSLTADQYRTYMT